MFEAADGLCGGGGLDQVQEGEGRDIHPGHQGGLQTREYLSGWNSLHGSTILKTKEFRGSTFILNCKFVLKFTIYVKLWNARDDLDCITIIFS